MAAMGFLLLGLVIGVPIGFLLGRRQLAQQPLPGEEQFRRPTLPSGTVLPPGTPEITKKARRLGLSEADFVPADDILSRMSEAWEEGAEPDLASADDVVAPPPAAPDPDTVDDTVARPPINPLEEERLRRVLARLEGQAPEGEPDAGAGAGPGPEAPGTVTEALALLAADGYEDDLHLDGDQLACSSCGASHRTDTVEVDRVFRFEGPSDPADEAIVLALRCPACGTKGALVSAFGPDADPALAEAFVYLAGRARHR
jgi:hypothetical protein